MFKRAIWFSTGAAAGLGSSYWVQRRVRRAAARLTPQAVGRDVGGAVRHAGQNVKAAVAEGRQAARAREAELTAELTEHAPVEQGPSVG